MKTILRVLMSLFMILLVFSSHVNAFTGQTHRDITSKARLYLLEEGLLACFSLDIAAMIADGSVKEDLPLPPPFTRDRLRSWFHYSPALDSWYASASCDAITWTFVGGSYTATVRSISGTYINDFNWPNVVDAAGAPDGWTALGHVVHLLEDMAVPAHTRNDPHPVHDPLEKIADRIVPALPSGQGLISVSDPQEDLFKELRNYTQSHYFSDDTCFHPGFPGPIDTYEDDNYFYDEDERRIAHKGLAYWFFGDNKRSCGIDYIIAAEQYTELGPIVVRYAASLIKYYCDYTQTDPCAVSENLIINGDCELDSVWNVPDPMPTEFSEQSSEQAHGGTYSWKIGEITGSGPNDTLSNKFSVVEGRVYNVSLWVYPGDDWDEDENYGHVNFYYGAHGDAGWHRAYEFGQEDEELGAVIKNQWNHVTFQHIAKETGNQAKLGIEFSCDDYGFGTYLYFDDVSVTEANQ